MSDTPESKAAPSIEEVLARAGITPMGEDNLERLFLLFILHGQKAAAKQVAAGQRSPDLGIGISIADLEAGIAEVLASQESGDPIQLTINITSGGVGFAAIRAGELEQIRAIRASLGINDEGKAVGHGPH